jgi:hypothetical protein
LYSAVVAMLVMGAGDEEGAEEPGGERWRREALGLARMGSRPLMVLLAAGGPAVLRVADDWGGLGGLRARLVVLLVGGGLAADCCCAEGRWRMPAGLVAVAAVVVAAAGGGRLAAVLALAAGALAFLLLGLL